MTPTPRNLSAWLLTLALVSALLSGPVVPVHALSLTVTNLNDSGPGSLRQAIADAGPGDTIDFGSLAGTITLTSAGLTINKNLTLSGPGESQLAVSGADTFRVLSISGATVEIDHLSIVHGYSAGDGGGIYVAFGAGLTLDHAVVSNNTAGQPLDGLSHNGAGIYANGASLTVQNSLISQNTLAAPTTANSTYGAGIFGGNPLTIEASTVDGNTGLTVSGQGVAYGIGVYDGGGAVSMSLDQATISNNTGGFYGGGFYVAGGTLDAVNSTFAGNSALLGSALRIESSANVSFNNVTIAKNSSSQGALYIVTSSVSLHNSILADDVSVCEGGTITSAGYNDVFGSNSCTFTPLASDVSADPLLSLLGDNGGPTRTLMLPTLSPAIDSADNASCAPSVDQRGDVRPFDGDNNATATCDMGAFELEAASATTITADTPDPSSLNQNVNVTVNVTSTAGGMPTGTVNIIGADTNCSLVLSGGTGSCNVSFASGGPKIIMALYPGDATHEMSLDTEAHAAAFRLTFYSQRKNDGWVLESSETSAKGGSLNASGATLFLGDDASNRQFRAILSFDTSALPDAGVTITSAMLQLRKQSVKGTNPFATHKALLVDIRKPFIGTLAGLQIGDFQAAAKAGAGTFGAVPLATWYSAPLNALALPFLNRAGTTQFRLRFRLDDNNDHGEDTIRFFSGNAALATNRPTLVIEYTTP